MLSAMSKESPGCFDGSHGRLLTAEPRPSLRPSNLIIGTRSRAPSKLLVSLDKAGVHVVFVQPPRPPRICPFFGPHP